MLIRVIPFNSSYKLFNMSTVDSVSKSFVLRTYIQHFFLDSKNQEYRSSTMKINHCHSTVASYSSSMHENVLYYDFVGVTLSTGLMWLAHIMYVNYII